MFVISFHFHPFPASKFRVLLAIWFVSFYNPNSLVSGENVWCSYEKASYRSHLLPDNHLPFLSWPHDPVRVLPVGLVTQMFFNIFISYCKYKVSLTSLSRLCNEKLFLLFLFCFFLGGGQVKDIKN